MNKRIITLLVLAALVLSLFAGCGSGYSTISPEKAQRIALKDAGLSEKDVDDVHFHSTTQDGAVCYNVHITVGETEYDYLIHAKTGEILSKGETE